jgi:hypothetical protein
MFPETLERTLTGNGKRMKKKIIHRVMRAFMAAGLAGVLPFQAGALQVQPSHLQVLVKPGSSAKVFFEITNDQAVPQHIKITAKDWVASPTNKGMTVSRWLHIKGSTDFVLKPKEMRKVALKLKCPKEIVGEVMGMTSFSYENLTPSMLTPMISVAVYMAAMGTEKISGEVSDMGMRYYDSKYQVGLTIKNTGNMHLRPHGNPALYDAQNVQVAEFSVPEGFPVFPGQSHAFSSSSLGVKLPAGVYVLKAHMIDGDFTLESQQNFRVLADGNVRLEGAKPVS